MPWGQAPTGPQRARGDSNGVVAIDSRGFRQHMVKQLLFVFHIKFNLNTASRLKKNFEKVWKSKRIVFSLTLLAYATI